MRHAARLTCTLAALAVLATPAASAGRPDPAEFAGHCIERATHISGHCAERNATAAGACVERIELLLEQGHPAAAAHLGARCIHRTNLRSGRCMHRVQWGCAHCIGVLIDLGELELAQAVGQACHDAGETINQSRLAAIQLILDALPDDGGGGGAASVPPCPSDVDLDGSVGSSDLLALLAAWGSDPIEPPDIDGDGVVDGRDLLAVIATWGVCLSAP